MPEDVAVVPTNDRRSLPWRDLVVVALIATVTWGLYVARTDFHVFPLEDVQQTVVAAREFAAGRGMTSRVAAPPMIAFLAERGREQPPWPNALRAPLAVIVMGGLLRVASEPVAVALSSGLFFLLAVPLIYAIAHRLAGRAAGVLAAAAFVVAPSGLYLGSTGLTESSTIFALAAIVLLLLRPITWRTALGAGLAAGVGYLGRSTMSLWSIVIVGYILWMSRDAGWWRAIGRAALFCAPMALAVWWWGAQMEALTGRFGYSAQSDIAIRRDTGLYPGRSSSVSLESWEPTQFIIQHPGVMLRKYARIAEQTWPQFITMGGLTLLVALFLVELVLVVARGRSATVHWLVYALLAQQLLVIPLVSFGHGGVSVNRYLDPLGPICATLGAAFAFELLRRYGASMRLAVIPLGLIVVLTGVPTLFDLAVGPYHQEALEQSQGLARYLSSHGSQEDVVASTQPALVSWSAGMYAIGLPPTPEQFLRMHREMVPADWVHIKHRPGNRERTVAWEPVMAGEEPLPGFELVERLDDGGVLLRRTDSR
ncbi:MAG: hypothetical protein ACP5KN_15970 [Armatimonadota bacterium]